MNCLIGAGAGAGVRAGGADATRPSAVPLPLTWGAVPLAPAAASKPPLASAAASAGFSAATTTSPRLGPIIAAPPAALVRFAPSAEVLRAERLPVRGRLSAAATEPVEAAAGPAGDAAAPPPKTGDGCAASPLDADIERAASGAAGCAVGTAALMELERLAAGGVMLLTSASKPLNGEAVAPPPEPPPPLPAPPMPSACTAARPLRHASATSFSSIAL